MDDCVHKIVSRIVISPVPAADVDVLRGFKVVDAGGGAS